MGSTTTFDFTEFNPSFERVVEIYNAWGSSECTEKEGNPRPIKGSEKLCAQEDPKDQLDKLLTTIVVLDL